VSFAVLQERSLNLAKGDNTVPGMPVIER